MLFVVAQAFYLFAPLLVASALSAVVIKLDLLAFAKRPIDGGATFRGIRLFGDNKTWRGVIVAVVGAASAAALEHALFGSVAGELSVIDHTSVASATVLGALIGLGAMLGELPNSFVKRRLGIAPGKTTNGPLSAAFLVWDQVDLLIGAWPFILLWSRPSLHLVVASFLLTLALHPIVSVIGYVLGARKSAR